MPWNSISCFEVSIAFDQEGNLLHHSCTFERNMWLLIDGFAHTYQLLVVYTYYLYLDIVHFGLNGDYVYAKTPPNTLQQPYLNV